MFSRGCRCILAAAALKYLRTRSSTWANATALKSLQHPQMMRWIALHRGLKGYMATRSATGLAGQACVKRCATISCSNIDSLCLLEPGNTQDPSLLVALATT